ncbi:MAG: sugar phosphate isomerase/epimerase [Anaerolineae bacterium]
MSKPIALQLYSLREAAAKDYAAVVRRVAAMGYDGVEPAGFPGTTPQAAGKLFRELGLQVPAAHIFPPPLGDKAAETADILAAIGCQRIVTGFGRDNFKTIDDTRRSCDIFNQAYAEAKARGLRLAIHNHWWEYQPVEGQYPYQIMLKELDPGIELEIDTYWVKTGGVDPVQAIQEAGPRATLLHIKDGPANTTDPMVAVGTGVMDFPAILKAAVHAECLIVELDRCATDMFEAVAKSVEYLKRVQS